MDAANAIKVALFDVIAAVAGLLMIVGSFGSRGTGVDRGRPQR